MFAELFSTDIIFKVKGLDAFIDKNMLVKRFQIWKTRMPNAQDVDARAWHKNWN